MGRYRPPAPKASPYITAEGYAMLEAEMQTLWDRRRDVTKVLSAAAAEGDRSENAEYIYRKKELAGIDRRIRYLQKRLPELTIVRDQPATQEQVFFSAWIQLESESGDIRTYRIVGADEIGVDPRYISLDSPMARALLKKRADDQLEVVTPSGKDHYTVLAVSYGRETDSSK